MYICAFNFDINWFTTLPGLLITGGVVLLLLALILFIASGHKKKPKKEDVVTTDVTPNFSDPSMNANVGIAQTNAPTFTNDPNMGVSEPVNYATNPVVPDVTPTAVEQPSNTMNTVQPNPSDFQANPSPVDVTPIQPTIEPVNVDPVAPVDSNIQSTPDASLAASAIAESPVENTTTSDVVQPVIEPVSVDSTTSVNMQEENNIPIVEPSVSIAEETTSPVVDMQPSVQEEPAPTIYGGASPAVDLPKEETAHQIYGGANPLDKTQTIPVIQETAKPETPAVETETPAEKTTEIPAVNPQEQPKYQEAKLVEDKDIEVLDF